MENISKPPQTGFSSEPVPEKAPEKIFTPVPDQVPPIKNQNKRVVSTKVAAIIIALIIIGLLAYYYKGLFVAATVNGAPISRIEVIQELEKASGKNALDALITRKLINDEARKKGIAVSNDDIDAEVKDVESKISAQGGTLDEALISQGMTMDMFRKQVMTQKELENILADKLQVTDEDIAKFISENEITIPEGKDAEYKDQIKEQIKQGKLSDEAQALVESLKSAANIQYFVNY